MNQITTNEVTMTIAEIAVAVKRDRSVVQTWIQKCIKSDLSMIKSDLSMIQKECCAAIKGKMAKASSKYPAGFTKDEVLTIVHIGCPAIEGFVIDNFNNTNLPAVLSSTTDSSRLDRIESLLATVASALVQIQVQDIKTTHNNLLEAPTPTPKRTKFTVREYFNEYFKTTYNSMNEREEYIIAEYCLMLCRDIHNMNIRVSRSDDIREIAYPAARLETAFLYQRGRVSF